MHSSTTTTPGGFLTPDPYLTHAGPSSVPGLGPDPNSPEAFRHNLQDVQQQVIQVQSLARTALAGIQNAYHPSTNPSQTSSDLANLKHAIKYLLDVMRQSGVGGLPLLALPALSETTAAPMPGTDPTMETLGITGGGMVQTVQTVVRAPSEEKLMEDTMKGIKVLFERQKRSQESAAVAANLLGGAR
ncbi:hypothetical protein AX15_001719 [Amanita polypyramis BW_CC]|nr:hypothetical protein AX15_001719 [Amanita polypyramis BW_CC]